MRVAIVGTGISGNSAALSLQCAGVADLVVYEKDARPGGHSATVTVDYEGAKIDVDTGFMVYNEQNYPGLSALFKWLSVDTQPSDMSFSVSGDGGRFEWCGRNGSGQALRVIDGLFARRRHFASPSFLGMLLEIVRFQKKASADARSGRLPAIGVGEYLRINDFSEKLRDDYLVPMGAAIWSSAPSAILDFPVRAFLEFFDNHALLQWKRPQWRTVVGGSRIYVERMTGFFRGRMRLGTAAVRIERHGQGVTVFDSAGGRERFDSVVIATHAPQALALLAHPSKEERVVLGACRTSENEVVLHRDPRFMPRRRAAWAAWNFLKSDGAANQPPTVTYWMNALQGIDADRPLFITLNPASPPDPALTFRRFCYRHPQYDARALAAQSRLAQIQGVGGIWYCGAWTGSGFHEDGLRSGLAVAQALGANAPWTAPQPVGIAAE